MATAACGINCNVCKLQVMGACSTCGSGISPEAEYKIQVQKHLFGQPCPILACAKANQIAYCMRDCHAFPCESFSQGPYPFSQSFIDMQIRRRNQHQDVHSIPSQRIVVPPEFWNDLSQKNLADLCDTALARQENPDSLTMDFLDTEIRIHPSQRQCFLKEAGDWRPVDHPLLELLTLAYLLQVKPGWLANDMIAVQELKDAQFFQGPHELKTDMVLEQFGYDIEGFSNAANKLGGVRVQMADIACKLRPFPKIPLYFLMWRGDDEFKPRLTILFDRSIDQHLSADAIWGLVNLVCELLVQQARQDTDTCEK